MKFNSGFFLVLFGILLLGFTGPTVTRGAAQGWLVSSEYTSPMPGQSKTILLWEFSRQSLAGDGFMLVVDDRDNKARCRAELFFAADGSLVQADCYREIRGDEVCDARRYNGGKPALLNHTIIPGDWLNRTMPFVAGSEKREYVIHEQIGTARFAAHLEVQERPVSSAEALSSGMLRAELQSGLAEPEKLYLVEVKRRSSGGHLELLLQQLWMEGDYFWLFEAKNGRRSWRFAEE